MWSGALKPWAASQGSGTVPAGRPERRGADEGPYEQLLTEALEERLAGLPKAAVERADIDDAEAPAVLARHVARLVEQELATRKGPERVTLANDLLAQFARLDPIVAGPRQLLAVQPADVLGGNRFDQRPEIALAEAALLRLRHPLPTEFFRAAAVVAS